jgi:hypothetical protein
MIKLTISRLNNMELDYYSSNCTNVVGATTYIAVVFSDYLLAFFVAQLWNGIRENM